MLDIKFIRENPDAVRENIKKKFQDAKLPLVDQVLALDEENRAAVSEANELRANRNALSKQVGMLMGQAKKDPSKLEEAEAVKAQVKANADRLAELEQEEDRLAVLQTVIRQQLNVAKTEAYIDAYLAKKNAQEPPKRGIRKLIVRDVRLFLNSVNHSLELVRSAGIQAETKQEETDREIVLTIRLPKRAG